MKKMLKMTVVLEIGILAVVAIACGSDAVRSGSGSDGQSAKSFEPVRESVKDIVIKTIKANREISEATISQNGSEMALVLTVGCETTEAVAQSLGNKFVRLVKQWGSDDDPSRPEIGPGDYDYKATVSCGGASAIAKGAKTCDSTSITW